MSSEKEREALGEREEEKIALRDDEEKTADKTLEDEPELDSSKVQFINANGGATAAEAHVDIEGNTHIDNFQGLTKEELMQYAKDPFWVKIRWVLFILFWVAWVGMLVGAIGIIILAPRCPHRPDLDWWQTSVSYQVYPRSFKDADGENGVGDLKGIQEKLPYVRSDLNATVIILGSIYPSPNKDYGYDVTDYKDVDATFGSLEDFTNLRIAAHQAGMKVILDFIPNHSSNMHSWFQDSIEKEEKYADYYVWSDGKGSSGRPAEPNNWRSVYGGSAWQWDVTRKQYYLHQYLAEQPDLNLRNEDVLKELDDVLRFWLDKGVDGFRIDSAAHLVESEDTGDEPASGKGQKDDYDSLEHTLTAFQPESYELVARWRKVLNEYGGERSKILMVESYGTANQTMAFYGSEDQPGAQLPLNLALVNLKKGCGGQCVHNLVDSWIDVMDTNNWPTGSWVLGNQDHSRVATRLGEEFVNTANMLLFTLPGTAFSYYGEEIGMHDVDIAFADTMDPIGKDKGAALYENFSRDPERTPMQWSGAANAGFTTADNTWLPVAADYVSRNVEKQKAAGVGESNLNVYSSLTLLRKEPSFQWGTLQYAVTNDNIFSYVRKADGFPAYLVAMNFGSSAATVNFHSTKPDLVTPSGTIKVTTANFPSIATGDFELGTDLQLDQHIHLRPAEGLVIELKEAK